MTFATAKATCECGDSVNVSSSTQVRADMLAQRWLQKHENSAHGKKNRLRGSWWKLPEDTT